MSEKSKITGNKEIKLDANGFALSPAYEVFKLTNFGDSQRYLQGHLLEVNQRIASYSAEKAEIEKEKKELESKPSTQTFSAKMHPYDVSYDVAAAEKWAKSFALNQRLEELKKPIALPDVKTLESLAVYAATRDQIIAKQERHLFQLMNYDELGDAAKEAIFKGLSSIHKAEYTARVESDRKAIATYERQRELDSKLTYSQRETEPPLLSTPEAYLMTNLLKGKEHSADFGYIELKKNSPEFNSYLQSKITETQKAISGNKLHTQQAIDLACGVYPQGLISGGYIDVAMEDMWNGFYTRTAINAGVGVVGIAATPAFGTYVLAPAAKAATPVVESAGLSFTSSLTGLSALDLAASSVALRAPISQALTNAAQNQALSGLLKIGAGAASVTGSLASGVAVEGYLLDASAARILEQDASSAVQSNGLEVKQPRQGELAEMVQSELVHDPLTWFAMLSGYEKAVNAQHAIVLAGKEIPSLCISPDQLEDGLKYKGSEAGKDISARVELAQKLQAKYDAQQEQLQKIYNGDKQQAPQTTSVYASFSATELQAQKNNDNNNKVR